VEDNALSKIDVAAFQQAMQACTESKRKVSELMFETLAAVRSQGVFDRVNDSGKPEISWIREQVPLDDIRENDEINGRGCGKNKSISSHLDCLCQTVSIGLQHILGNDDIETTSGVLLLNARQKEGQEYRPQEAHCDEDTSLSPDQQPLPVVFMPLCLEGVNIMVGLAGISSVHRVIF
jgi:hypothetical protein